MRFSASIVPAFLAALVAGPCLGQARPKAPAPRRIIDVHLHARAHNDYAPTPPPNPVSGRVPAYRSTATRFYGLGAETRP